MDSNLFHIEFLSRKSAFFCLLFILSVRQISASNGNTFTISDVKIPCQYHVLNVENENASIYDIIKDSTLQYYEIPDAEKKSIPGKTYWLRFSITNKSQKQILLQGSKFEEVFTLYYPDKQGCYVEACQNFNTPFYNKEIFSPDIIHILPYTDKPTIYYLKIRNSFDNGLGCYIHTLSSYNISTLKFFSFNAFLYGAMLFVMIPIFLMYIKLKERIYLFYTCYLATALLYILISFGITIPAYHLQHWDFLLYNFHYKLFITFLVLYAREFLNSYILYPLLDRVIVLSIAFRVFLFGINFFIRFQPAEESIIDIISLIPIIYIAYLEVIKGKTFTIWFSISMLLMVFSLTFDGYIHRWTNFVFFDIFSYKFYFASLSILFEIILFSIALSERFQALKREVVQGHLKTISSQKLLLDIFQQNEILKDKLNSELEEMVTLKTAELSMANTQLKAYAAQVGSINEGLIIDKEKLLHDVELLTKARVIENNVNYLEFTKTFLDEDTSLKFIADLKAQKGFKCKKCGYKNKFNVGKQPYSRKCPICKYTETVTGYTLLENIKFSPQKALFIVYKVHSVRNLNLNQLSEELELRKGTCYSFAEKVAEALVLQQRSKGEKYDWTDLLFSPLSYNL